MGGLGAPPELSSSTAFLVWTGTRVGAPSPRYACEAPGASSSRDGNSSCECVDITDVLSIGSNREGGYEERCSVDGSCLTHLLDARHDESEDIPSLLMDSVYTNLPLTALAPLGPQSLLKQVHRHLEIYGELPALLFIAVQARNDAVSGSRAVLAAPVGGRTRRVPGGNGAGPKSGRVFGLRIL